MTSPTPEHSHALAKAVTWILCGLATLVWVMVIRWIIQSAREADALIWSHRQQQRDAAPHHHHKTHNQHHTEKEEGLYD